MDNSIVFHPFMFTSEGGDTHLRGMSVSMFGLGVPSVLVFQTRLAAWL